MMPLDSMPVRKAQTLGGEKEGCSLSVGSCAFASFLCELQIKPSSLLRMGVRRVQYGVSKIIMCGILLKPMHPFMTLNIIPPMTFEALSIFPPSFYLFGTQICWV